MSNSRQSPSENPNNSGVAGSRTVQPAAETTGLFRSIRKWIWGEDSWLRKLHDRVWGYDYFISYHWKSGGAYAVTLAQRLRDRKFDVFLDRGEYAGGDNWRKIGKTALANTQRLILVATREAIFDSEPVKVEVENYSKPGRRLTPIYFGDRFNDDDRSRSAILQQIPPEILGHVEMVDCLKDGPSEETLEGLVVGHRVLRRRSLRRWLVNSFIGILSVGMVIVLISYWQALAAQEETEIALRNETIAKEDARDAAIKEREQRIEAQHDLALNDLANAGFAIREHRVDDAMNWYARTLEDAPERDTLIQSARILLGSWNRSLRTTLVHDAVVNTVAFSPDGRKVHPYGKFRQDGAPLGRSHR